MNAPLRIHKGFRKQNYEIYQKNISLISSLRSRNLTKAVGPTCVLPKNCKSNLLDIPQSAVGGCVFQIEIFGLAIVSHLRQYYI